MSRKVPVASESVSIGDVEKVLRKDASQFDSISYVYVVGKKNVLRGVISVREVFTARKRTKVADLLKAELVSVRPYTDQERVAMLALSRGIKGVPVIDSSGVFLGAVTGDAILRILNEEAKEDILRFGGVLPHPGYDSVLHTPFVTSLVNRLPWLFFGLAGGIAAAGIVNMFESIIAQHIILAAFIPLIVYMSDAVGAQMQAFIIRDLAAVRKWKFITYFMRQARVVITSGMLLSLALFLVSMLLYRDLRVSVVLGTALFVAILSSLVTGLAVPYLFFKFRFDPANASGPVGTIIQDIVSVSLYLLVALVLL